LPDPGKVYDARMVIAAIMMVAGATLSWIAVRRCPLARAIGLQISQVSASDR
jgi:hypothetical protein